MNARVPVSFLRVAATLALAVIVATPVFAQSQDDTAARLQELQSRLDLLTRQAAGLQKQIDALKASLPAALPSDDLDNIQPIEPAKPVAASSNEPSPEPTPLDVAPVQNASTAGASKILNPDISVIGNFVGHAGNRSPLEDRKSLSLDETEVGLEAFVDPYAKAKFFLSFGEDGVEVEEGFINFINLPADLTMKVGKVRANFGKVNTMHTHARPWVDQPLALTRFFGPDGLSQSGVSVSKLFPNGHNLFVEGTAEVLNGEHEEIFGHSNPNDLLYVGHLKTYKDITDNSNFELGGSLARGSLPAGGSNQFAGGDVTFRWKPLQRSIYNSFIGRAEVMVNDRADQTKRALGFYTSADYQFAQRWFTGVRYDMSDRPEDPNLTDRGVSATLTFWPSEFSQIRGQYRRMFMDNQQDTNELMLQFNFSIGAHGAHTF